MPDTQAEAAAAAAAAVAEEEIQTEYVWYFAIGSMMNRHSCKGRDFHPKESKAAELKDYRMHFFSRGGVAEAQRAKGESMHGVIHRVTPEQMLELDKIEFGYIRETGQARAYDTNEMVTVTVYCRPEGVDTSDVDKPPTERYLQMLIEGAKQFGLDLDYIKFLENHPYQPRKLPSEFCSFENPPEGVHFDTVPPESEESEKLYFSLNGKILEYSLPKDHRMSKVLTSYGKKYGPHLELINGNIAYDPKYGLPCKLEDVTKEFSCYVEDINYRWGEAFDILKFIKVVGSFSQTWSDE